MLKSVKVKDYMATNIITFKVEMELFAAVDILIKNRISGAPVVDNDQRMIGMFSESDCLKVLVNQGYYESQSIGGTVGELMTGTIDSVSPEDDIIDIIQIFVDKRRRRLPVALETGELIGQISRRDILRAMKDFANREG